MYHFHLLKVAGRCPAMILRIWWIWRDQPHDHVISDNHQVVSHDQVLCLYQDPVAYKEMFFKMHIVLHLWMVWHSFRIPGACVMILPLEIATISTWHFFPPLTALIPQGPPNCVTQVVVLLDLSLDLLQSPFLLWALLKFVSFLCMCVSTSAFLGMEWLCCYRTSKDPLRLYASFFVLFGARCNNLSFTWNPLNCFGYGRTLHLHRFYLSPSGMHVFYQGFQNAGYLLLIWHDQYSIIDVLD